MTAIDDDDLPVLTQVLRTGDGRLPPPDAARVDGGSASPADPDRRESDDAAAGLPWPRALVIGSDPEAPDDTGAAVWRDAAAIRRAAAPPGDSAGAAAALDASGVPKASIGSPDAGAGSPDVFLRSAPPDPAFFDPIDEPPLIDHQRSHDEADRTPVTGANGASALFAISRDVPLTFGDRPKTAGDDLDAPLTTQVRDSVLQELSARIDTELDARIAQTLHAALESALGQLQASLRVELAEALRDVVGRAVDDAVSRLRDAPPPAGGT